MNSYPFTAILGQEEMQTALLVNAVDPGIGGVLVRGQKGTGKSTAARALSGLLPLVATVADCPYHCHPDEPEKMHSGCRQRLVGGETLPRSERPTPFVDLPLSATEDRLVGTLNLEQTLQTGQRQFEPGLLAAANRGILYVDEVNLLPDHLVDLLLDAAASQVNIVEREGLRIEHPASFILIGTMNPEEGDLRPQFLDRFGLCVNVVGEEDPVIRRTIVQHRLGFDSDPEEFRTDYLAREQLLADQILRARQNLAEVTIPAPIIDRAVELATAAKVQGHRADLALVRTARALTALCDRTTVTTAELAEAARFVLPHRLPDSAGTTQEILRERVERLLQEQLPELVPATVTGASDDDESIYETDNMPFPGSAASGGMLFTYLKKKSMIATSRPTKPST
jgi:Mg-chelatase subunit ChlI